MFLNILTIIVVILLIVVPLSWAYAYGRETHNRRPYS